MRQVGPDRRDEEGANSMPPDNFNIYAGFPVE